MNNFWAHTKKYIYRGVLAVIPLYLSYVVLKLIFVLIDKKIVTLVNHYIGYSIPGLGLLIVLVLLYFLGLLVSNVVGKTFFSLIERVLNKIPIINTTYEVGKQVSSTLSLSEKQVFHKAGLLKVRDGVWAVGFVTGTLRDQNTGEIYLKTFVPHVPNPTSGFILVTQEMDLIDVGWTVEDAIKIVISGGIIGPATINTMVL
ncbi:MAG: DUF502 domain-containing protein [Candidatus Omnitrophica bacterium]|nr:DUF502 domain-containing protein [Candidatus Omnitrophota bacterium]